MTVEDEKILKLYIIYRYPKCINIVSVFLLSPLEDRVTNRTVGRQCYHLIAGSALIRISMAGSPANI